MNSSPIDLVARRPAQHTAPPSETESDERFSDLLRQPSDTTTAPTASPSETGADDAPNAAGHETPTATDPAGGEAADHTQSGLAATGTKDEATAAATPSISESQITPLVGIPDAITNILQASTAPQPIEGGGKTKTAQVDIAPLEVLSPTNLSTTAATVLSGSQPAESPVAPVQAPTIAPDILVSAPTHQTNATAGPIARPTAGPVASALPATPTGTALPTAVPQGPATSATPPATLPVESGTPTIPVGDQSEPAPVRAQSQMTTAAAASGVAATTNAAGVANVSAAMTTTVDNQAAVIAAAVPAAMQSARTAQSATGDLIAEPEPVEALDLPAPQTGTGAPKTASAGPNSNPSAIATVAANPTDKTMVTATPTPGRPDTAIAETLPNSQQPDAPAAATSAPAARPASEAASLVLPTQQSSPQPPASEQIILQVRRAVAEGVDRLTVQLKPAALGRVDVQMEVGFDGRVQAVVSAERPETLHLLQRDARALTTALNDAGLQADSGSLSFNLRGQSGDQAGDSHGGSESDNTPTDAVTDDIDDVTQAITLTLGDGRVDIKV